MNIPDKMIPDESARSSNEFGRLPKIIRDLEKAGIETDIEAVEPCGVCGKKEPENEYWQDLNKWFCWYHSTNFSYSIEGHSND